MPGVHQPALGQKLVWANPVFGGAVHFDMDIEHGGVVGRTAVACVVCNIGVRFPGSTGACWCEEAQGFLYDRGGIGQGLRKLGPGL